MAIKGHKKAHYILSRVLSQAFKSYSLQDTCGLYQ